MKNINSKERELFENEKTTSGILTAVIVATVISFNIVIFVIANLFGLSFTTKEKDLIVLTGNTDSLFEDAINSGKKVTVTFCFPSPADLENHETGSRVQKTALEFAARYGDFIEIQYVNLVTRVNNKGDDVSEKIKKWQTDMRGNKNYIARGSVVFECGNNYKVVTDTYSSAAFADFYTLNASGEATSYNGEAYMAAMINWVTTDKHPTAYFTVGHSEQLDRAFANVLISAGYYISTVDLKTQDVPADAGLLIISNPLSDFEKAAEGSGVDTEYEHLSAYVKDGGNIYVALDPYVRKLHVLEGFLAEHGISYSETEKDGVLLRNIVKDSTNAITTDGFTLVTDFADNEIAEEIGNTVSSYSDGSVIVREAAALKLSGNAKPLLVSTPSSIIEADGDRNGSDGSYLVAAYTKIKSGDNVASLCVVSSVYISVSDALVTNGYSNTDFLYSLFENFYGLEGGMPYGCAVVRSDTSTLENMTMGKARIYTAFILAIPVAVAVLGTVVVIKRKNR